MLQNRTTDAQATEKLAQITQQESSSAGIQNQSSSTVNHQRALGAASEETRTSVNPSFRGVLALPILKHMILDSEPEVPPLGQQQVVGGACRAAKQRDPLGINTA